MTDILAGATVKAADRPAAAFAQDTTTLGNQTNTTFEPGSPVVDLTFTAPRSGRILLILGAGVRDNAGTNHHARISAEIYEGTDATGTLVFPAAFDRSVTPMDSATQPQQVSAAYQVDGLTPEATHYARVMHQLSGGTSVDISLRDLSVIPLT